jgi:hypothetical protein
MSESSAPEVSSPDPLKSIADAMDTAILAAREGASDARAAVDQAVPAVGRFMSRLVYTTCYTISYGVVFPTLLVARAVPKNNPIVHGLVDGARAASDMVDELHNRRLGNSSTGASSSIILPS